MVKPRKNKLDTFSRIVFSIFNTKERTLFQKVAFYRGTELFNEGNFDLAKENFVNSLTVPLDAIFNARAAFWKGESNYRLNNFIDALSDFKDFYSNYDAS